MAELKIVLLEMLTQCIPCIAVLVYVNINLVSMDGGWKSTATGLASYRSLRHHHNVHTMRHSRSFMDQHKSELHSSNWRQGKVIREWLSRLSAATPRGQAGQHYGGRGFALAAEATLEARMIGDLVGEHVLRRLRERQVHERPRLLAELHVSGVARHAGWRGWPL